MGDNGKKQEQWPPQGFQPYVPASPFLQNNGAYYQRIISGDAASHEYHLALKVEERQLNGIGTLHGGMLMTLGDFLMGRLVWTFMPDKQFVTAHLSTDFISAAEAGRILVGKARFVHLGSSLAFAEATLESEARLVAAYRGIWKQVFNRKRGASPPSR